METTWCIYFSKKAKSSSSRKKGTFQQIFPNNSNPNSYIYRTINLIIEVDVAGNVQYSTPKSDVATNQDAPIVWDEHLFFELKNLVSENNISKHTNKKKFC